MERAREAVGGMASLNLKHHLTRIYDVDNPEVEIYATLFGLVGEIQIDQNRPLRRYLKDMDREHRERMRELEKQLEEWLP